LVTGKVGRDLDLEAGRAAENLLSVVRDTAGGDFGNVERLLTSAATSMPPRISAKSTR
jgi:hypothetical protein